MKFIFAFALMFQVISASANTTLDLDKLKLEAISEINKYYQTDIVKDDGQFYYWDGVGSTLLTPMFDYSSIMYIATPSIPLEMAGIQVAYRLRLHGETQVILSDFLVDQNAILVLFPGSVIVGFKPGTTLKEQEKIAAKLTSSIKELETTHLRELNILLVAGNPHSVILAAEHLRKENKVADVNVDGEIYSTPFEFDVYKLMTQQSGKLNVDSLRTISQSYYDAGNEFTLWTNIPERLQ